MLITIWHKGHSYTVKAHNYESARDQVAYCEQVHDDVLLSAGCGHGVRLIL